MTQHSTLYTARQALLITVLSIACLSPSLAEKSDQQAVNAAAITELRRGNVDGARSYQSAHHPVRSTGGMVVSQSRPASAVGVDILRNGGNAVDAAVAVGLAMAVTLPRAGNLGGGGFMVIYLADEGRTTTFDYYGAAPAATTVDLLLDKDGKPRRGAAVSWKSVAVPGTVAAFYEAQRKYGKLPWAHVVQPAIELAERGVRLSDDEVMMLAWAKPRLSRTAETRRQFYRPDGSNYQAGDILRQPDLAWSLRQIAQNGADAFYRGEIAQKLVAASQAHGGLLTARDLTDYRPRELAPIKSRYRGIELHLVDAPASGVTLAGLLNMLERFPMKTYGQGSAQSLHLIAEASRLALADRRDNLGGPPHHNTPSERLISKEFAKQRARLIAEDKTLPAAALRATTSRDDSPDTTHFSVVDAAGNVVSNTYTLSSNFGAAVIADGTGILLNNSMGNFSWGRSPNAPNVPAPGKRATSTSSPFIAFKDGRPWLVAGTPGGASIIQALAQFIVNTVDYDLNIAEASARPRINAAPDGRIDYEQSLSPDTVEALKRRGHKVEPSLTQTSIQAIEIAVDGSAYGSADSRRPDSAALGVRTY